MNTLVSSGCSSIKSFIVINIDIDQYQKNNRDNIFCNIAQPYFMLLLHLEVRGNRTPRRGHTFWPLLSASSTIIPRWGRDCGATGKRSTWPHSSALSLPPHRASITAAPRQRPSLFFPQHCSAHVDVVGQIPCPLNHLREGPELAHCSTARTEPALYLLNPDSGIDPHCGLWGEWFPAIGTPPLVF